MPGRLARVACSRIMSAAMSATARSTAAFCFAQSVPPIFASFGASFVPPTYFCTSSMHEAGTKIFVLSANSISRNSSVRPCCSRSLRPR